MANLIEKAKSLTMSRRRFLGVTAATAAAATLPGCGLSQAGSSTATADLEEKEGKWAGCVCL